MIDRAYNCIFGDIFEDINTLKTQIESFLDKNNMPKFDVIVGNPPYEGQGNPLYLKIAEICVKNCEKVIWLCPTQWSNTLKNVKWYDYYKENLNCEFFLSVGNPFDNAALANEVGIYVFW